MSRYVTVTEIQDYLSCEWRWYAKWVLNRVPRRYSSALILGSAVHNIFKAHFKGYPLDSAFVTEHVNMNVFLRGATDPAWAAAQAGAMKDLLRFRPQIVGFRDKFKIDETLEVEEEFQIPLGPWIFRGRPDRVVRMGQKCRHMQHKTVALNKSVETYLYVLQRSLHETMYGDTLAKKYGGLEYAGSIINLIRKGVAKPGITTEGLGFQALISIDPIDRMRSMMRARLIVERMVQAEETGKQHGIDALIDNPLEDAGVFGNSLDGYLPVLQGKTTLDDETLFTNREETYDVIPD